MTVERKIKIKKHDSDKAFSFWLRHKIFTLIKKNQVHVLEAIDFFLDIREI